MFIALALDYKKLVNFVFGRITFKINKINEIIKFINIIKII